MNLLIHIVEGGHHNDFKSWNLSCTPPPHFFVPSLVFLIGALFYNLRGVSLSPTLLSFSLYFNIYCQFIFLALLWKRHCWHIEARWSLLPEHCGTHLLFATDFRYSP